MLLSPVMMAVLLSPRRAMAKMLLSPLTRAVLWLPSVAVAELLSPLTNALLWSPTVAVAVLFVPWTIATEPLPTASTAFGSPTRSSPLVATLTLGSADAAHGVAASPTPIRAALPPEPAHIPVGPDARRAGHRTGAAA